MALATGCTTQYSLSAQQEKGVSAHCDPQSPGDHKPHIPLIKGQGLGGTGGHRGGAGDTCLPCCVSGNGPRGKEAKLGHTAAGLHQTRQCLATGHHSVPFFCDRKVSMDQHGHRRACSLFCVLLPATGIRLLSGGEGGRESWLGDLARTQGVVRGGASMLHWSLLGTGLLVSQSYVLCYSSVGDVCASVVQGRGPKTP